MSNTLLKRVFKLIFICIAAMFFCVGAAVLYLVVYLNPLVKARIIETVAKSNDGTFTLKIGDININPFRGAVAVKNITLNQHSGNNLSLHSKALYISNFRLAQYIRTNKVEFDKITIESPELIIKDAPNLGSGKNFDFLIPKLISNLGGSLKIGSLSIRKGTIKSYNQYGSLNKKIGDANIELMDLKIDTLHTENSLQCNNASIKIQNYEYSNGNIFFKIESAEGSLSDSLITIKKISCRKDKEMIKASSIQARGLDLRKVLLGKSFNANEVFVESPSIIYTNQNRTGDHQNKDVASMLNALLRGSYKPVNINLLSLANGKFNISLAGYKHSGDHVLVQISKIRLDTINSKKEKYFANVQFKCNNYLMQSPEQNLSVKTVSASSENASVSMSGINFNYGISEGRNKDRMLAHVKSINGEGIDFNALLVKGDLFANKITINNPVTDMNFYERYNREFFKHKGNSYQVKKLEIYEGKFILSKNENQNTVIQKADHVSVEINNLKLDKQLNSGRSYEDIHFRMNDYLFSDEAKNIKVGFSSLEASKSKAFIKCQGVDIRQLLTQSHQYTFSNTIGTLSAEGFDLFRFLEKKELVADRISSNKFKLEVDSKEQKTDGRHPISNALPKEMMAEFKSYFLIKEIDLSDASISYIQRKKGAKANPVLTIEDSHLRISNLSNDPFLMTESNPAELHLDGQLLGKGSFILDMHVPLLSNELKCDYKGMLSNIDAKEFNNWLALGNLEVKKGMIDQITFDIHIDGGKAKGQLKMLYHNFSLNLLNKKTHCPRKALSCFANAFLNNKNRDTKYRSGETIKISLKIEPEDNFVYSLWRPLKSGMVNTVSKELFSFSEN